MGRTYNHLIAAIANLLMEQVFEDPRLGSLDERKRWLLDALSEGCPDVEGDVREAIKEWKE